MIEIERKFLVVSEAYKTEAFESNHIIQGFLNKDPERTVRIRLYGDDGFLTVKGLSTNDGLTRFEWEKPIAKKDAETLLAFCEKGIVVKTRYKVKAGIHIFEVDEFGGDNQGLTIAEIELNNEDEIFDKPKWLGDEVTGNMQYYNSQLSIKPYKTWDK